MWFDEIFFRTYFFVLNPLSAKDAMRDGRSPIIIDNTNTQAWEMKPYVQMVSMGLSVQLWCTTPLS